MIWLISDTHFNHDKKFIYGPRGFNSVQEADSAIIKNWNDAIGKDDHYPTQTADLNSDPKTCVFNIYGHVHSKEKFYEDRPYMYCVALDAQDNKPVSIEQIYQEIQDEIRDCIRFLV